MTNEQISINDFIDTPEAVHPKTHIDQIKKMIQDKWTSSTDILNATCITISSEDYKILADALLKDGKWDVDSEKASVFYHGLQVKNADSMNSGECEIGYR
ncbi:hypothetical protein [Xanthocytophaga agilis]|uniref:Uncharacterized protein n=1 Tax=Xanthocytophaga agilis TaxID=3048010 RepID=A0AAE3QYK6_9BACT|nr:hypothetical protein [Xanthocytophaga agilis]MDJ1499850.1 hypothetical protein [Xanthocytophaga agilis]